MDAAGGDAIPVDAAPSDAGKDAAPEASSRWLPLGPDEEYAGYSLEEWAVKWGQWVYADTGCDDPRYDEDGSLCALYQNDPSVFFLASTVGQVDRTRCVVPAGKAILVPINFTMMDNGGVEPDAQLTEELMQRWVDDFLTSSTDLTLTLDGVTVKNLEAYKIGTTRMSYDVPPEPNWYSCSGIPGVVGKVDPSFLGGFFVLLPPPAPGSHVVEYSGAATLTDGTLVTPHVRSAFDVR